MKKERLTYKQGPIQLSSNKKSHSINLKPKQQSLFSPYKIQWKPLNHDNFFLNLNQSTPFKQPFRNVQNITTHQQTNSNNNKIFYENMKNQLLIFKQDVQKLILKQKRLSISAAEPPTSKINTNCSRTALKQHQNTNSNIKSISIKNKCQQKINKVQTLYENVDKALANKIGTTSNFTENFHQNSSIQNLLHQRTKNNPVIEYKSKDKKYRNQFKQIPQNQKSQYYSINNQQQYENKLAIVPQLKCTSKSERQKTINCQSQKTIERPYTAREKLELDIMLPFFEKQKDSQKIETNQTSLLIHTLKNQLKNLQNQLSSKNYQLLQKEQQIHQFQQNIEKLQKQSNQQKNIQKITSDQINLLRSQNAENQNRSRFFEDQLQKAIYAIQQKQQESTHLAESLNNQNKLVQQLSGACENLSKQVLEMKKNFEENKNIKEKIKFKDNQIYIYQEELKQAKIKIKQLKNSLSQNLSQTQIHLTTAASQSGTAQKETKIKWELTQTLKLSENLKQQNQRLKSELKSIISINSQNQQLINSLVKENEQQKLKLMKFERESRKDFQQAVDTSQFQSVGQEISRKLSQMIDENYQLKNKITNMNSTIEEITLINKSLLEEVKIYEEKNYQFSNHTRRLKIEDWDNLTSERDQLKNHIETLKAKLQQTKQFYELQTIKKQNEIAELKEQIQEISQISDESKKNSDQQFHFSIRSVKHIKNINSLLTQFKDLIEQNIQLKKTLGSTKS